MAQDKRSFTYSIKNDIALARDISEFGRDGRVVMRRTVSDVKKRGVPIVRENILKVYGLQPRDLKDKSAVIIATKQEGGGDQLNVGIVIKGRLLTARRFGMTPTKAGGFKKLGKKERFIAKLKGEGSGEFRTMQKVRKPYDITVEIFKGHKKTYKSSPTTRYFLQTPPNGTKPIPWQASAGGDLKAITTLSVPQMVGNKDVNSKILNEVNALYKKRFTHNFKQVIKNK